MLIAIVGKAGTGKSSVVKEMEKLGYKKVVTDTTRPPRKGEVDEVDYHFDSDEMFDELLEEDEFIETTSYRVHDGEIWRYGTTKGAIRECGENAVIILNPIGVRAFRKQGIPVLVASIESNEMLISLRLSKRGDFPSEIKRRIEADNKDFADIHQYVDFSVYNDKRTDLTKLAKVIIRLAKEKEQEFKDA